MHPCGLHLMFLNWGNLNQTNSEVFSSLFQTSSRLFSLGHLETYTELWKVKLLMELQKDLPILQRLLLSYQRYPSICPVCQLYPRLYSKPLGWILDFFFYQSKILDIKMKTKQNKKYNKLFWCDMSLYWCVLPTEAMQNLLLCNLMFFQPVYQVFYGLSTVGLQD